MINQLATESALYSNTPSNNAAMQREWDDVGTEFKASVRAAVREYMALYGCLPPSMQGR
jgi:hypothetical protein